VGGAKAGVDQSGLDPTLAKNAAEAQAYTGKTGAKRRMGRALNLREKPNQEFDALCKKYGHKGPYLPMIIEACGEDEFSYEYKHGTLAYGAFTYSLASILRRLGHGKEPVTFQDLRDLIAQQLADLGYLQSPHILGPQAVLDSHVPWKAGKSSAPRVQTVRRLPQPARPARGRSRQSSEQTAAIVLGELESKTLLINPTLDSKTHDWFADIEKTDKATARKPTRCDLFPHRDAQANRESVHPWQGGTRLPRCVPQPAAHRGAYRLKSLSYSATNFIETR
jgi:hypothetical protein